MIMFRHELKNNVKNKLIRDETIIINFEIMIEQEIDLNDRFYEQIMKKKTQMNIKKK